MASRDSDIELSQLALTTLARVAAKDAVVARLGRELSSRAERSRAQAAAAAIGLVDRDAALAIQLLEPVLEDPSHDVRAAMVAGLAAAYVKANSPEQLITMLTSTETTAMRRVVVTAALVTLARTEAGKAAAASALERVRDTAPPMARQSARLALGLIAGNADGLTFLQQLVP